MQRRLIVRGRGNLLLLEIASHLLVSSVRMVVAEQEESICRRWRRGRSMGAGNGWFRLSGPSGAERQIGGKRDCTESQAGQRTRLIQLPRRTTARPTWVSGQAVHAFHSWPTASLALCFTVSAPKLAPNPTLMGFLGRRE